MNTYVQLNSFVTSLRHLREFHGLVQEQKVISLVKGNTLKAVCEKLTLIIEV